MTNDMKEIVKKSILEWESRGPTAPLNEFFIICNKNGANEEGIIEFAILNPEYATYRDYYIAGKISRNGRMQ